MHYIAPTNLLKDKTLFITGASDGIGQQAALSYAQYGASLYLLGRREEKLQQLSQQLQHHYPQQRFVILPCDLLTLTPSQAQQLAQHIQQQVTHLDGLLHNASLLGQRQPMAEQPFSQWREVMQVNVDAAFILTQALLPLLLKAPRSALLFTSSSVGQQGRASWGAYAVSKFATEGMMQVLAQEYQATPLRVNAINPGGTRTAMRRSAFPDEDANQLLTPAQIMPLYLYLMGDDSSNENGRCFNAQPNRRPGSA